MNQRQIGRFRVAEDFVRKEPEKLAGIFSMMKTVPVRIEYMFDLGSTFEFTAIAECFEELEPGQIIPEYDIRVEADENDLPGKLVVRKAESTQWDVLDLPKTKEPTNG